MDVYAGFKTDKLFIENARRIIEDAMLKSRAIFVADFFFVFFLEAFLVNISFSSFYWFICTMKYERFHKKRFSMRLQYDKYKNVYESTDLSYISHRGRRSRRRDLLMLPCGSLSFKLHGGGEEGDTRKLFRSFPSLTSLEEPPINHNDSPQFPLNTRVTSLFHTHSRISHTYTRTFSPFLCAATSIDSFIYRARRLSDSV